VPAAKHGGELELSGTRHQNETETTRASSKGARASSMAAALAKRPARLDGRLSGDGRSARRREKATTSRHHARAQGSLSHGSKAKSTAR
jgi:hypothetical protein